MTDGVDVAQTLQTCWFVCFFFSQKTPLPQIVRIYGSEKLLLSEFAKYAFRPLERWIAGMNKMQLTNLTLLTNDFHLLFT